MRPDVAGAYDQMAAAARADGLVLVVVSGFRSDAEQAELFAAHPDPKWVAPPGHSLHRCATELDLGPSSAYGWLAGNADRFGFAQRYSYEPWHYGFDAGPAPCSPAGEAVEADGGRALTASSIGLPSFVPSQYRGPILRSAARWGVPPALMAGQLMAESGFDPNVGSPAGAQGIAQFMPSTAASYGLTNPYDPVAAIDAEAHLMSDLLHQFGSPELSRDPGLCHPHPRPDRRCRRDRHAELRSAAGGVRFQVKRMREIYPSAFKHGISKGDIGHVLKHAIRIIDQDDGSLLYLGAAASGKLLEVVTYPRPDGSELVVHAMKMRPGYANLLPRE